MVSPPSSVEFMLILTLLLASAILIGVGLRRIGLPTVLGFILVGMLLGPYGISVIEDIALVNILADIGLVLLVFVIGLEFSISKFRKVGSIAMIGALVEVGLAFLLSFILSIFLGFSAIEALYIGGIVSITSTAIVLKLLKDAGIVHTREAEFILLVSIVEDIFALILIAMLPSIVKSGTADVWQIASILGQNVAFLIIALLIGLKAVPKAIEYVARTDIDEAPFLLAISLGFGLALLANYLGLSMTIGAFLMGMMIASSPRADVIISRVQPLRDFFGTLFFISIGMLISLSSMFDNLIVALPLIVIAIIAKFVGNFIAASMVGFHREGSATVGIMMMPRGELSFVMAKQGVDINATKESILPITMLISLASVIVTPILWRALPNIVDARTWIPLRLLSVLEYPSKVIGFAFSILQSNDASNRIKSILPKTIVNIAIIVAIITIISVADNLLLQLYNTFTSLRVVSYNIFKTIFMLTAIVYPLFNIFGRIGYTINAIIESIHTRINKAPVSSIRLNALYRISRNILLIVFVLIVTSFIIPSIVVVSNGIDVLLPSSIAALIVFIYLLFDTFIIINTKIEKGLEEIIFKEEKEV
jgi:CPA2 family monovalent cation:H+ antiporter-2